ncbi:carbohydrate ABC transporter permease [Evansella tamaricis]
MGALFMTVSHLVRYTVNIGLLLITLIIAFPFIWMLIGSIQSLENVRSLSFSFDGLQFSNFYDAWNGAPFGRYFFNSFLIAVTVSIIQLVINIFAAYAFARLSFKGKNVLFIIVLSTMMIPAQAIFIPNFIIISGLNWYNTYFALIIPFCASAFGIFLIRQAFLQVPKEIEESAILEGANHLQIIYHMMIPLAKPTIITCILLCFISQYSDLFWPLIVTNSEDMRTVQVGLSSFMNDEGGSGPQWHILMAASTMVIMPLVILFIMAQKYIMKGVPGAK